MFELSDVKMPTCIKYIVIVLNYHRKTCLYSFSIGFYFAFMQSGAYEYKSRDRLGDAS